MGLFEEAHTFLIDLVSCNGGEYTYYELEHLATIKFQDKYRRDLTHAKFRIEIEKLVWNIIDDYMLFDEHNFLWINNI